MDQTWIETVGRMSLPVFFVVVGAGLIGIIVKTLLPRSRRSENGHPAMRALQAEALRGPAPGGVTRRLLEYVGNTTLEETEVEPRAAERRRDRQARKLFDVVERELTRHEIASSESERILEEMRESIRGEGPSG